MSASMTAETDLVRFVLEQARAAMAEYRAIERYFQHPAGDIDEARRAAETAAGAAKAFEAAVETAEAPRGRRKDLFLLSRALGRLSAAGLALVLEAARYGVPEDPRLQDLAHAVRRSAEELSDALERLASRPASAPEPAARAAHAAGHAEHLRRGATKAAAEEPNAVLAVKLRGLHRRFSEAAAHAAEAADLVGALLG